MAAPINRGDDNPQLQKTSYSFGWKDGTKLSQEFKGINPQKIIDLWNANVFTVEGAQMTVAQGMAELTLNWASFGGGGTGTSSKTLTLDRWEIPEPKIEKPLISHPEMYDIFAQLNLSASDPTEIDGNIGALSAKFQQGVAENQPAKDYTSGATTLPGWFTDANFPGIVGGISNDALHFLYRQYNKCLNGQTHYQDSTYSLRHTTNTPAYWSANVSDVNTNCIYTTAQLLSEVQNSAFWFLPLPGRLAFKISAASAAFISSLPASALARNGYLVGWLKSPFGEASVGRNKIEIQGSYVLDQWPLDTYPAAV